MNPAYLLAAVVAGWAVQAYFTYRQSQAFRRATVALRDHGTVSVGVGGRRYRGGRAFVALAFDPSGRVQDAIVLRGFTTFARPTAFPSAHGLRASRLAGDDDLPGLRSNERDACRQAAQLWRQSRKRAAAGTPAASAPTSAHPGGA
jgi:glucitol operon activator protein